MNERIKELAAKSNFGHMENGEVVYDHRLEKFAELIVKECIHKIEKYRIPVGNSAAGEMACEWTYDALKEIRDEIKKHFGDEE